MTDETVTGETVTGASMTRLTSHQRRTIGLIFAITLTSIMGNSLLAPVIPNILETFGRDQSGAGLIIAATSLPGIFMAPIIGLLADRFGRRNVLVPCLAVFGISGVFVATAPSYEALIAARLAMGFGAAGLINLAVVLIGDTCDGDERTHWLGRNAGVLTIALAVFPVISGLLTDAIGWRWALAPLSLGIVTAFVTWIMLEPGRPEHGLTIRQQLSGARAAIRDRTILTTVVTGGVAFAIIFGVFLTVLPNHPEAEFGLSARGRGLIIGLPMVTSSLLAFDIGRLRRRVSMHQLAIGSATIWAISFLLIGLAPTLVLVVIGCLLYGLGEGGLIPSLQDTAIRRAPDDHRGAVMASWTGFARLGQTTGPLVAGAILAGSTTTWGLLAGTIRSGALLALFVLSPIRSQRSTVGS